jgi:AcrR family transcriptional regulator
MTSSDPIFGVTQVLPRGPHRLSREAVGASQRSRLQAAIAEVVAEKGYGAATIGEISSRAGVSPRSFYEHFEGKQDCFLAAYDSFVEFLLAGMGKRVAPDADWLEFLVSTLDAYLGTLERMPVAARAFLIEMDAAGPVARRRRLEAFEQFARLLKARHESIRREDPTLGPLPDRVYLALALGVRGLVCDALDASRSPRLTAMTPDIIVWITATIHGATAALEEHGKEPLRNHDASPGE